MRNQTGKPQKVSVVNRNKGKIGEQVKFLTPSLRNNQDDQECQHREAVAYEEAQQYNLEEMVVPCQYQVDDIEQPDEIQYRIVKNILQVRQKIEYGEVAVRQEDVPVLAHTEADE